MGESQIKLTVNNFRAIESAEIELDGITVVSGENGCGKSTLSKLLYYTFKIANEYEASIYGELITLLKKVIDSLENIFDDMVAICNSQANQFIENNVNYNNREIPNSKDLPERIVGLNEYIDISINYIKELCVRHSELLNDSKYISIKYLLINFITKDVFLKEQLANNSLEKILDILKNKVNTEVLETNKNVHKRDLLFLDDALIRLFNDRTVSDKYNLYEYGSCITNRELNRFMNISTVEQVLYMDTPMAIGMLNSEISHWQVLNKFLINRQVDFKTENSVDKIIESDILHGTVFFNRDFYDRFTFKRADGLEINLLECATGAKSFAALQVLLKNGFFNDKTLMMIDEPEAHLHPQWIVEFARMIVLLNKELGVKFFIASHSPDMISAIKYISEKEGVSPNLNFYLAEKKNSTDYTYSYRALGTNIDDIYASFNIAFDKIDLYGTVDDEVL